MSDSPQQMNSLDCWDYTIELECLQGTQDLQLAAELGKTLLERNKELESSLKQHQNVIEDQTQEIEYLTKQTVALREVNDSRLRIYEQLEVSIQDLERANHRLAVENSNDKKHIKSLTATIESLEAKCEELSTNLDELKVELEVYKKKALRPVETIQQVAKKYVAKPQRLDYDEVDYQTPISPDSSAQHIEQDECISTTKTTDRCQETQTTPSKDEKIFESGAEQLSQMAAQLKERESMFAEDQRKIAELEEQLSTMVQRNHELENQMINMQNKDAEDMKSMQDELSTLEEVRQGQLCSKCLRNVDPRDDMSLSLCDDREDDDSSMLDALADVSQHRSSFTMDVQEYAKTSTPPRQENNLYRDLVEKYEALVKVQKHTNHRHQKSLHEEGVLSGDFNNMSTKDTDEESGHGDSLRTEQQQQKKNRKNFSQTPTDFSEAETSSSGFSDETSNKATQTDRRTGSFLCTIGDGEDCFSIYDDASNFEERFRNRPQYRDLFSEIFGVLKKAAKNKDDNEELPLLDDCDPNNRHPPKVPPVTPCTENLPDFPDNCTDDTQSVMSSTMSEVSTSQAEPTTVIENIKLTEPKDANAKSEERTLTPLVRQPLEYLSVGVNVRKRSSSRRKKHQHQVADRSDSPMTHIVGSPTVTYGSRPGSGRRRPKNLDNENWNGNTIQFWSNNRNVASPTPSQGSAKGATVLRYDQAGFEFKPSTASQDLHKLKKLDLSYAEVLRKGNEKKRELSRYKKK
ncbi:PREDICTED: cerebellar degeneration-related protein 2-like [Nicrophorus vespilloides]|uniref:Cerebellar degeneration-related protein 2-like n=1 Tax=Nicrophorus vespilloides TaxID=110193 RepID=A0ABM1MJY2_NICVS|nr:PREDICTED: cerebellar degeneration-related protein 2-like [Nicrophorus vespilloides]